jgi:hypothetical protein
MSNPDALAPCRAVTPMLHTLTSAERAIVFGRLSAIVDQELAAAASQYETAIRDSPADVRDFVRVWLDLEFATTRAAILDVIRELVMPRHIH